MADTPDPATTAGSGEDRYLKFHGERDIASLADKQVSPQTLRHTCAMRLLESGTDIATIALFLGHEQLSSTNVYLHAHLALKEQALARTTPPGTSAKRYKPGDSLMAFLHAL